MYNDFIKNVGEYSKDNPDITDAIKEGYVVAFYDKQTKMIMVKELTPSGELKIRIIEDAYLIENN